MQNLKKMFTAATAVLISAGAAQAADAIVSNQPYEPSPMTYAAPASMANWSGLYLGAAGTWDWGTFDNGNGDANGWGASLFGGYNMQSGSIVYGVETDVSTSHQSQNVNYGIKMEQGLNGSLRARVGYAFDPVLIYGTGGLAGSKLEAKQGSNDDNQMAWGYTLGAGVEAMVTDNISARAEYRYTDYADQEFNLGGGRYKTGFDESSVRVGLGVHF